MKILLAIDESECSEVGVSEHIARQAACSVEIVRTANENA
jgi:hypothetical protein